MATSWNIPALLNKIATDVPNVNLLLKALLKWDVTGTEDIPSAAKRLASVTGGVQFQNYNGSAWASVGKLMHDVDMLDGYHASTSATANTIPIRNANGAIPGNITGNAATATQASGLTNDYVMPIANGGTGASTAAGARQALGTNNAANITTGTLATARGGTGRTDGMVTDVYLTEYSTTALTKGVFGTLVDYSGDLDALVVPGHYYYVNNDDAQSVAKHYPHAGTWWIDVERKGTNIRQTLQLVRNASAELLSRWSFNTGASWGGWHPICALNGVSSTCNIYVAKDGSDTNSGLSPSSPVLTWNRVISIARTVPHGMSLNICVGAGEWGGCSVTGCGPVHVGVTKYDGVFSTDAVSNMPHFTNLEFGRGITAQIGNVDADLVRYYNCEQYHNYYCKIGGVFASTGSHVTFNRNFVIKYVETPSQDSIFSIYSNSMLVINAGVVATLESGVRNSYFCRSTNGCFEFRSGANNFSGTFTGSKYSFSGNTSWNTSPEVLPGTTAGTGNYSINNTPQKDVVLLSTNQTISGSKTFTGTIVREGTYPWYLIKSSRVPTVESGDAPTADAYTMLAKYGGSDVTGANNIGSVVDIIMCLATNKTSFIDLRAFDRINNNGASADLRIVNTGTEKYATCPTPANANDNSEKIATTAWVTAKVNSATPSVATSATKLQNSRNIWGRPFDGTADVTGAIYYAEHVEFSGVASGAAHGGFVDFHYNANTADFTSRIIEESTGVLTLRNNDSLLDRNGLARIGFGRIYTTMNPTVDGGSNAYIGSVTQRWSGIFLTTQPNVSSDIRLKKGIKDISKKVLDIWKNVAYYQFQYREEIVEDGSRVPDRTHTGVVAQQIEKLFKDEGLDPTEYSFFCHDTWEDKYRGEIVVDKEAVYDYVTVVDAPVLYGVELIEDSPEVSDKNGVILEASYHFEEVQLSPEQFHIEEVLITPEESHIESVLDKPAGDEYSIRYGELLIIEAAYQRRRADELEQRVSELESRLAVIEQLLKEANVATQK